MNVVTGQQRILAALGRGTPDRVPTFEWFIDAAVGRALAGSDDPLEIVDRLDLDAVNVRPDYARRPTDDRGYVDEWGIGRRTTDDALPAVVQSPLADLAAAADYRFPDPAAAGRLTTFERALRRFDGRRAVVLNLRDGFSDLRDLMGYQNALMAMLVEPERFESLLARAVDYNLAVAEVARRRFGAQIVATTDDVANAAGLLMRPQTYFDRIAPAFRRAIAGYKDLGCLVIKHCDGAIDAVLDFWLDCGIDCLDPVDPAAGYSVAAMRARTAGRVALKGNVDCTGALCGGTAAEVEAEVRRCLAEGMPGGGFILSSSNTIHRGVRPENYGTMLDALRRYGAYDERAA